MEEKKPGFDLTVINPDVIIGPMLQTVRGPTSVNETNKFAIYDFMNEEYKQIDGLTFPFYHFVSTTPKWLDGREQKLINMSPFSSG
jgi:hypothetical protein